MKVSGDEEFDTLILAICSQRPDRNITLRDVIREAERRGIELDVSVVVRSKPQKSVFDQDQ